MVVSGFLEIKVVQGATQSVRWRSSSPASDPTTVARCHDLLRTVSSSRIGPPTFREYAIEAVMPRAVGCNLPCGQVALRHASSSSIDPPPFQKSNSGNGAIVPGREFPLKQEIRSMSSDNQFTALGPAVIGFQTDSASITTGALLAGKGVGAQISGHQIGAVITGQDSPDSGPTCGAQVSAIFPDVTIDNTHFQPRTGLLAFGDGFALMGITGDALRKVNGQVDQLGIPISANYGVTGAAFNGPGVLGIAAGFTSTGAPTSTLAPYLGEIQGRPSDQFSTGVLGACSDGPGVTGVSPTKPGVMGASDSVGVFGSAPAAQGYPLFLGNTRGVGVLGVSASTGVVGISTANVPATQNAITRMDETRDVGVAGIAGGIGVEGVSYNDRAGVFQTLPPTGELAAQVRLVPLNVRFGEAIKLPTNGKIGDLLAVETSLPVPVGEVPTTDCHLYLCTRSGGSTFSA